MNTQNEQSHLIPRIGRKCAGSVMIITLMLVLILMLIVGTTLLSTTNKYFTAYQWASWQEALQGAESGADIAMAEMRKDIQGSSQPSPSATPWVGWNLGNYKTDQNGNKSTVQKDTTTYKGIGSSGTFANNNGNGNQTTFNIASWENPANNINYDFLTYSTQLTPHAGEGNTNLRITVTVDKPSSLLDPSSRHWLRVRATGTTDLAGPSRVSEEKLDNHLRKLGLFLDKVLAATGASSNSRQTTRQIELVAKPVTYFTAGGVLTAMVQIKSDKMGIVTNSFNSEDPTHWPIVNGAYDLTVSLDPTNPLGKNGDVSSNALPIKHDHTETMNINGDTIWGDVSNNEAQITGLDPAYYSTTPNAANYGLDNGNYGSLPTTTMIDSKGNTVPLIVANGTGDVSGSVSTSFYRDLPPVLDPTWTTSTPGFDIANSAQDITSKTLTAKNSPFPSTYTVSSDPTTPTLLKVNSIQLNGKAKDKVNKDGSITPGGSTFTLAAPTNPNVPTDQIDGYVQVWVTGGINLDDGGTVVIQSGTNPDGSTFTVHATIYSDKDVRVGENTETKTNSGGFWVQSDDAKDLVILGVNQPDNSKKADDFFDENGNAGEVYSPYKASGTMNFVQTDFTGAIYAPDFNLVFDNQKDGKGKRKNRPQTGNDFYGSFVGRTINTRGDANNPTLFHYDESLNDIGTQIDWGYVSWFEDVDVDHR